jgi:hypothetical protein
VRFVFRESGGTGFDPVMGDVFIDVDRGGIDYGTYAYWYQIFHQLHKRVVFFEKSGKLGVIRVQTAKSGNFVWF